MNDAKSNWITVTESPHPWERDALDFVRERWPDHEPYRNPFDIVRFRRTLDAVFPGITDAQVTRLVQSAEVAAHQRHGTMLVVTRRVAEETHRLRQQATPIQPKRLDDSEVDHVTRIDGVLLDQTESATPSA